MSDKRDSRAGTGAELRVQPERIGDDRPADVAPLIWLLLGRNHGDNTQARTLAELVCGRIDGSVREWPLSHNLLREVPNDWLGRSLRTLRNAPAFSLPWPDMVIGVGRRNVPAARWIAAESGGKTKLVWLGRPRAALHYFDLVLATAQYGLGDAPNLHRLSLPFSPAQPAIAGGTRRLVMLGGPSWSARITTAYLDEFARIAGVAGTGRLSVITSPRSPAGAATYLGDRLGKNTEIYDWARDGGQPNPYRTWLAEAESCVLSGDSVSLLSDAVGTGRPVTVVPAPPPRWLSVIGKIPGGRRWLSGGGNRRLLASPPDLGGFFQTLITSGLARREGGAIHLDNAWPQVQREHQDAAVRVAQLLT
ncbi:MAG: ELM1/GtrOC1 family putative glycosyltransferase [Pseudomonadota bacterium]